MARQPRVFIASGIFYPEPGGPATYLHELLPALQARGWDIRALAYGDSAAARFPYPVTRVPRLLLPLRYALFARHARPLLKWADVTYIHSLGLPLFGRKGPRVLKVVGDQAWERAVRKGWISPTEDIDLFQQRRYGRRVEAGKAVRSRDVVRADAVIVPSEYLKSMVVGWGADPGKVRVIYNALPDRPSPSLGQEEARARLALPDSPLLLTAARLLPWKGVDHLIAALRRVPEAHLLVAGDGPSLETLRAQARSVGLSARVRFLGHVRHEDMPLYMQAADYTVLYSGYEGLSHTLLESLRVGTPVIASDKGGNPEIVRHEVNGLLVPYVDGDALIAALQEALRPGKRAALAANSHAGMERFAFERMVDQTDAALREHLPVELR